MDSRGTLNNGDNNEEANEEIETIKRVIGALLFYERHAAFMFKRHLKCLESMSVNDKAILAPILQVHVTKALKCAKVNQEVLERIVGVGFNMFGDNVALQKAYENVENSMVSEHYMSKTRSTLKQIVRDWSKQGEPERKNCYSRCMKAIQMRYPETADRHKINVLIPGSGLGRLNYELMQENFSVCGNEFSFFMILTSNYLLNFCSEVEEFTIYPYLLDFSNSWSFEDNLRPIKFPDVAASKVNFEKRQNNFSMCAGDFVGVYKDQSDLFECVLTVFFLDTATNPIEYMRIIYGILKPGGCWINFGPLTYHFEGEDDNSLELPFDQLCKIAEGIGFQMLCVEGKGVNPPSTYTGNPNSMLCYQYNCGFFECTKPL